MTQPNKKSPQPQQEWNKDRFGLRKRFGRFEEVERKDNLVKGQLKVDATFEELDDFISVFLSQARQHDKPRRRL